VYFCVGCQVRCQYSKTVPVPLCFPSVNPARGDGSNARTGSYLTDSGAIVRGARCRVIASLNLFVRGVLCSTL
jgi:hypothetical protein